MSKILVISPHPDDESIGCGGTLKKHVKAGDRVHIVFLTSGEKGAKNISSEKLAKLREQEALEASKILGFHEIEFWREPDGALKAHHGAVKRLQKKLSEFKPDIIYVTHEREMHGDHRAAARIVRQALKKVPRSKTFPDVFCFEVWTPIQKIDHIVDISEFINDKMAAIRKYKSQCRILRFDHAFLGLSRYRGEMHCWPGGDYAEVFSRIRT